jgi:chromosome segregation ATPase
MKPTTLKNSRFYLILATLVLTAGLVSWDHKQAPGNYGQPFTDTTPKKKGIENYRDKKITDLDDVLEELNNADLRANMEQVHKQLSEAMEKMDLKQIDLVKMKEDLQKSLSAIDMEKMKAEMKEAFSKVDMEKMKEQMEQAFSKVDMDKIKEEMEKVKEVDMEKVKVELEKVKEQMKDMGPKLEQELSKAKIDIEKAKEDIKEYKTFVDDLASDGLIDKKAEYTLKHDDGELFINGKKASEQTYNKYRSFLEKHKKFKIEKSNDNFNIDMD